MRGARPRGLPQLTSPSALTAALVLLLGLALAVTGPGTPTAHAAPSAAVQPAAAPAAAPSKPGYVKRSKVIGRSVKGRPIKAFYRGTRGADHVLVVLGQMHGNETAGPATARWMRDHVRPKAGTGMWVVPTMNPDGAARRTRTNARGVDLNRNWPTSGWSGARRGTTTWGGPRPASEPETRALIRFLRNVKPDYIASIHQPLRGIGSGGRDVKWERRLAKNLNLPRRYFGVGNPTGTISPTMTGWYGVRMDRFGVATTIEYGARTTRRYRTKVAGRGIARAARVLPQASRRGPVA
ncbi:DUF2817 domain-containing protein [Nocardioides sp. zg-536]|uniref:DUF2817 domain-containing protein n=1 Tax=Nocardioides faecalis TaxID=2803858 RepID=A0A939BZL0_9ACTN|nr:M14 family zinc carboxypeptidase [Nocardioides faecalis]MBM9461155.1 DUF2817 domain-containing protein [Nocardioides faecalis]QVI59007.1 DUF2817 domain-containing protein [Nocardioides faecalis]